MNIKTFIAVIVTAIILVVGFFALNTYIYNQKQGDLVATTPVATSYAAELTGELVCLSAKVGTSPSTMECRFGIVLASGEQYALDFTKLTTIPFIEHGSQFTAKGVITPAEYLSSAEWQKYEIRGIFSITEIIVKQPVVTTPKPTPVAPGACYIGGCSGQICSGEKDMMSTCEYREAYACYKNTGAVCERQASGECGWTETTALTACLNTANTPN